MLVTFCSCGDCTNFVEVRMRPLGPVLDKCYKCFAKSCEHGKPTEQDYKVKEGDQYVGNKWAQQIDVNREVQKMLDFADRYGEIWKPLDNHTPKL